MPIPRFADEQLQFEPPGYLLFGDNLEVLRRHIPDETIDLIYLDPPFNSKRSFNLLFEYQDGTKAAGQQKAFDDTWSWSLQSERVYEEVVSGGGRPSAMLRGMREIVGPSDMLAYIVMMTPRLIELHRTLKPTGTLYLHCDPTASHYIKAMLDAIFGPANFLNEIVWHYRGGGVSKSRWGRRHDILFFYSKGSKWTFNVDPVREAYSAESLERLKYKAKAFRGDRVYDKYEANPLGKHPDDVWNLQPIMPSAKERLGYPTQKPLALLERIVLASTNEGDTILDPFCGCGTTIEAAQLTGRRWLGIDITKVAIDVICERLKNKFPDVRYVLGGQPATIEEAVVLAQLDRLEFQKWALELIKVVTPVKPGADRGIDGEIVGTLPAGRTWRAIVSVKGGGVSVQQMRDLRGTVAREKAEFGIFLTLRPPTGPMRREAAEAGFTKTGHPMLQILTIAELFEGKKPDLPPQRQKPRPISKLPLRPRVATHASPVRSA